MSITPEATLTYSDQTPFNESRALKKKLAGVRTTSTAYPEGREVPVFIGLHPDFELRRASYPGIYITYAGVRRASDREHRGPTTLHYAPPGYPTDVQVPVDMDDKENTVTESWDVTLDPRSSPYYVEDYPIPLNLDFNVTVLTRTHDEAFRIIWELQKMDRIPERYGHLAVPEDGTLRTLELLGGPETSSIRDEDGKRIVQTLYSVRVTAELLVYELEQVRRVEEVVVDFSYSQTPYL